MKETITITWYYAAAFCWACVFAGMAVAGLLAGGRANEVDEK